MRRGHANLLGGRATRRELYGLAAAEIGADLDLLRLLNHGYLPRIYNAADPRPLLDAYVSQYLMGVGLELRDSEGLMGFAEAAGGWR